MTGVQTCALPIFHGRGLDRVDDQRSRLHLPRVFEDDLNARLREQVQPRGVDAQPRGPQPRLLEGLLPRGVQGLRSIDCEPRHDLEEKRGLADAGFATDQDDRSRDDAAAKDAIELPDAAGDQIGRASCRERV